MKKGRLDNTRIMSELKASSVFFQKDQKPEVLPVPEVQTVRDVPPVRPVRISEKREVIRHPFNIYRDQLQFLRKIRMQYMMDHGEDKGMSEFVREALDSFISSQETS